MTFCPDASILAGMTTEQLRTALTNAQQAYLELQTGSKVASVSYAQGESSRSVSFTKADAQGLVALIKLIQAQLGIGRARRPVRFNF